MPKIKIVHIISSLKIGGAESLLVDLLSGLGTDEFEHHVIFFHDGPNRIRIEKQGVKVYKATGFFCLYDPLFFIQLLKKVKEINPDLLHTDLWAANFFGRIVGKLLSIPVVSVIHLSINQDGYARNVLDAFTFSMPKKIITVSEAIADEIKSKKVADASKIHVIRNGINPSDIVNRSSDQIVTRESLGLSSDNIVIGSVGRFIPRKNYSFLIRLFHDISKENDFLRLVLVGCGSEEQSLKAQVSRLGLEKKVIFVVGKPAYGYYPLFDCFVLTSFQEGVSIALLEAMCLSIPCMVSSDSSKHEVIKSGKNGFVVRSNDYLSSCEALKTLVTDRKRAKTLGGSGYQTLIRDFALNNMVQKYKNVFYSCIKNRQSNIYN